MLTLLAASFALAAPAPVVLTETVAALEATVEGLTPATCGPALDATFVALSGIDPAQVDRADVAAHPELVQQVWTVRLGAGDRLRALHAEGEVDEACITGFRRLDLATRYLVDHLLMEAESPDAWLTTEAFTGLEDLRSGDVLVTRGSALSSAGIAHIGSIDSQFSHNAMVHIDAEGRAWTIEAYLERGGLVQPLDDFLHHGLGRVVVVRHDDAAMAARASHLAFQRIRFGAPIDYDEAFDGSDGGDELFCSEIAPWAFAMAGGDDDIPLHQTRFPHQENGPLFQAMGITTDALAAPVDLLFDPRFQVVAEWRDLSLLETMRRHDAVVEAMFRWMSDDGYALRPAWSHRATVDVGLAARRTPLLSRAVAGRVHPHGDRQFLVAGLVLQDAGQRLWEAFDAELPEDAHPSYASMHHTLDALRDADAAVFAAHPRKADLHRVLRPEERPPLALRAVSAR